MTTKTMPALSALALSPDVLRHRLGQVGDDYMRVITNAIENHPRTLQEKIGPSEIGHACPRRIGYKLLNTPERVQEPNWKATIGTGAHMWLETAFDQDNLQFAANTGTGQERWYIETQVSVGVVDGVEITGHCDLYDRLTGTVVDHKTVGPTQLKKYKAAGPGQQYRVQANLYGYGWRRAGLPVNQVMIAFLPRNGSLAEAYIWQEPYDEQCAIEALQRLSGIAIATRMLGPAVIAQLPAVADYCAQCPYFHPSSRDLGVGCPGAEGAITQPAPALTINQPHQQKGPTTHG